MIKENFSNVDSTSVIIPTYNREGTLKEYVVILNHGEDFNTFWQQMEWNTQNVPFIPDRPIAIANERLGNERSCHYILTDEEALTLSNDTRIHYVGLPPEHRQDSKIRTTLTQSGNFVKGPYHDQSNSNILNWGAIRVSNIDDQYGSNAFPKSNVYTYLYDGTGVDVVIQDSGIHAAHPEWADANGNSRLQQIDWWEAANLVTVYNMQTTANVSVHGDGTIMMSNSILGLGNYSYINEPYLAIGGFTSSIGMINRLGLGSEDGGRSYRIRGQGDCSFVGAYTSNNKIFEVRFLDNGWIEMLIIKNTNDDHSKYGGKIFFGLRSASQTYLANCEPWLNTANMLAGNDIPRSVVITRNSNSTVDAWTVNSGNAQTQSYHAELYNNTWVLVSGVATTKGMANLYQPNVLQPPFTQFEAGYPGQGRLTESENYSFNIPFGFPFAKSKEQAANHYIDIVGHGTHCAGTIAGKNYGFAKNANIYASRLASISEATGGYNSVDSFDLIKKWHQNKPIDPVTGFKRPTVVNMSWGNFGGTISNLSNVMYRGNIYSLDYIVHANTTPFYPDNYGDSYPQGLFGIPNVANDWLHNLQVMGYNDREPAIDAAVEDAIAAGVHFIHAVGNNYDLSDVLGGPDYNNYIEDTTGEKYYYARAASPYSPNLINVGAISSSASVSPPSSPNETFITSGATNSNLMTKASFSSTGPAIDIWAPGTSIISATSNVASDFPYLATYYADTRFKQAMAQGTSMAAPHVAGVAALFLQVNPGASPAQFKQWLGNTGSIANIIYDNLGTPPGAQSARINPSSWDYPGLFSYRNLWGAPNKLVYSGNIYPIAGIASLVYSGNNNSNITITAPSFSFGGPISFKNINIRFA